MTNTDFIPAEVPEYRPDVEQGATLTNPIWSFLDSVGAYLVLADERGSILWLNHAFERELGVTRGTLQHTPIWDLLTPEHAWPEPICMDHIMSRSETPGRRSSPAPWPFSRAFTSRSSRQILRQDSFNQNP